jgi:hypothetical protein
MKKTALKFIITASLATLFVSSIARADDAPAPLPPMKASEAESTGTAPAKAPEPVKMTPSSNHGYIAAQGTINQPYGANPYRTLVITVSKCDTGYSPYVSMGIGGVAGWLNHTIAEAWAVPTNNIKWDGNAYNVQYRAEARFYNGGWAWSSNVYITWVLYCIPTDSFTYTPH